MAGFIGRQRELAMLDRALQRVREGGRAGRPGRAILMRGRRRVGKSRLVEELVGPGHRGAPVRRGRRRVGPARIGHVPGPLLTAALPVDRPCVVVLDDMPYLAASDAGFEGTLQKLFDRELARRPALVICIGSDLAMMEALNDYGRPFHQRASEMVVPPLDPADVCSTCPQPRPSTPSSSPADCR